MTQVSHSLYFIDETSPSQPGGVFQIEHDISLPSTSINIKTMNPDFTSQSFQGVVISSILQSITPRLSLGLESAWQRQPMAGLAPEANTLPSETSTSFLAKFTGVNKDWVAAATLMPANGALNATFWRRLGEKVEAGVALDLKAGTSTTMPQGGGLMAAPMMARVREGTATVGVKYEFRTSMFRGQIDSGGRVSAFLDKRLSPQIGVSFCGDIDHFKVVLLC
jgi:mitochondrial import receptor subunit TOM40